eukprot:scaffold171592_cov19-Tisochrysis_lutea.AAC.1
MLGKSLLCGCCTDTPGGSALVQAMLDVLPEPWVITIPSPWTAPLAHIHGGERKQHMLPMAMYCAWHETM